LQSRAKQAGHSTVQHSTAQHSKTFFNAHVEKNGRQMSELWVWSVTFDWVTHEVTQTFWLEHPTDSKAGFVAHLYSSLLSSLSLSSQQVCSSI
jgi:nitric oxide synthase oxygenase domain/subunit